MFHAWLRTSTNPTYDDVIKALEAVGENAVARNLRDPVNLTPCFYSLHAIY